MTECSHCGVGRYHLLRAPYLCWLNDQIVVVPQAPASQCDVCGTLVYDPTFLGNLEMLLEHNEKRGRRGAAARHRLPTPEGDHWQRVKRDA